MGFSLGGFVSDLFGSKNKTNAAAPAVDPHAYQYGGQVNGANTAADRYQTNATFAQQRQGEQANYGQADQAYAQSQQARQGQQALAQQMQARATGQVPSIAGMQAQQDMQRAQAAQTAQAASARGPAGLALAQQNAANNTANAMGQISGQAQVNAANERLQAEQNASTAYGNLRGGDQQSQGQLAQQSQFNAQLGQNQHALNDQMTLGMTQAEQNVRNSQLTAGMNQQAQQSANALGATGINAGIGGQNAAMNQQNAMGVLGMGSSVGGQMAQGKAKGGPSQMGKPYIVGEKGPELIVPKTDGTVIPNHKLGAFLAAMHGGHAAPRAEGGPVQGYAPSTWGIGGPNTEQQDIAKAEADAAVAQNQRAQTEAAQYVNPYQSDLDRVAATRRAGLDVNDQDAHDERVARSMLRYQAQRAGKTPPVDTSDTKADKAAVVDGKAIPKPPSDKPNGIGAIVSDIGSGLSRQAAGVDVGYHGGYGYQPPQLLAIQARANGGPIEGPSVPMMSAPTLEDGGPQGDVSSWKGLAHSRNDATMALMGYSPKQAESIRNPNGAINAFEGGGTAPGGKPALVGERGPEIVIEEPKEPRWRDTPLARALASGKSQEGAASLPLDEGQGKYLQQSEDGHAFMAAAPTEADAGGRPSLAQIVASMKLPRSSPSPSMAAAKPTAPRKMTDDELMAAANAMGAQQRSEHEARMAAGPALRVPVDLGQAPGGQPVAQVQPEQAIAFHAQRPSEESGEPLEMPPSPTALPPPKPPAVPASYGPEDNSQQWAGTNYRVIPKDLSYSMSRRSTGSGGRRR